MGTFITLIPVVKPPDINQGPALKISAYTVKHIIVEIP